MPAHRPLLSIACAARSLLNGDDPLCVYMEKAIAGCS